MSLLQRRIAIHKSEVDDLKDTIENLAVMLKEAKADAVREYSEELYDVLSGKGLTFTDWIEIKELKRKYTEGANNEES